MTKRLSDKQKRIQNYITRFISDNGYPPSIREIQQACRISSTSVVDYNLNILENRGVLERRSDVSRGIKMVNNNAVADMIVSVPIVGMIAAGIPIPAMTADTWDIASGAETMGVPAELTGGKDNIFALRVKGLSMIDALINDGDIVLMQPVNAVENGEMAAVWLKSEKEVTLKKVFIETDRVRLQPANSQMQPIYADRDNVEVQGRVIAVVRQCK